MVMVIENAMRVLSMFSDWFVFKKNVYVLKGYQLGSC